MPSFEGVCDSAEPAAVFEVGDVLLSRNTFDAAVAAAGWVVFLGASVWDSALAAALFEGAPVFCDVSVCDAAVAAFAPVTFCLFIFYLLLRLP